MRIAFLLSALSLGIFNLSAQSDSCLSYENFIGLVLQNHPIALQANNNIKSAEAKVYKARGEFDPFVFGAVDSKDFDNKNYFRKIDGGLKVPTWYGVEFNSKFTQNSGTFLNPENNVPSEGLVQAGMSINLGQGLLIDKRRAVLQKAKLMATKASEFDQLILLNDLLLNAANDYWKWVQTWHKKRLYDDVLALSKTRYQGVKRSFEGGDRPAIDTVEAMLQIQNWEIKSNELGFEEYKARLQLSNHLWNENTEPLEIQERLSPCQFNAIETPQPIASNELENELNSTNLNPKIQSYDLKLEALEIERRFRKELLKPTLKVEYNFLNPGNTWNNIDSYLQTENNKWGLTLSYPILSRKQRADVQLTKFELENTKLKQTQAKLDISNKLKTYFQEQLVAYNQNLLLSKTVTNYQRLLIGERSRFNNGESSLFLINAREAKLVEAKIKQIDFETQYRTALIAFKWSAYTLAQ